MDSRDLTTKLYDMGSKLKIMNKEKLQDKCRGCLVGGAVGDAFAESCNGMGE